LDGTCQVESFPQFPAGKGVQVFGPGTPAKEVGSTSADLAGTGTGHEETDSPALNQAMDFVQELGQTLNLIYDNQTVLWGYLLCDTTGILTQSQKDRGVQKVIHSHVFHGLVDQRCLAGLAWSKKKMRLFIKERRQIQNPVNIRGISIISIYCDTIMSTISCCGAKKPLKKVWKILEKGL